MPAASALGPPDRPAWFGRTAIALVLGLLHGLALAQGAPAVSECGSLYGRHFGPLDYLTNRGNELNLVESAHFNSDIENLIRGGTGSIGQDMAYTLRAYPNHHRALAALVRYAAKLKTDRPTDMVYSVDCWFDRALRWRPNDTTSRLLYVTYLVQKKRSGEALSQLALSEAGAGDNAFTLYNIGLLYFELQRYDEALASAHRAAALGFTRPELRDRLESVGAWREPSTDAERPPPAASAASAPSSR